MAGTCSADLDQHLPWPRFWRRYVPELPRLLPFDELEGFDFATCSFPVASLALTVRDPVELDLEMQWAAEDLVLPVGRRIDDQARVFHAT